MTDIVIAQSNHLAPKQIAEMREIYLDSFSARERAEFSSLINAITAGERWLFTAVQGDDLVGFAILLPSISPNVHFLEYLAVASQTRNSGLGGALLEYIADSFRIDGSARGIIFEVETDEEGTADERQLRKRRIAFYQRHNAALLESVPRYRVPSATGDEWLTLKLMWLPLDGATELPRGAQLREYLVALYQRGYGLAQDHPLVREALRGIG